MLGLHRVKGALLLASAGAAAIVLAVGCGGAGVGEPCTSRNQCASGLVCDPISGTCQSPGPTDGGPGTDTGAATDSGGATDATATTDSGGTDAGATTDAGGTDAGGTDSGRTDAGSGTDSGAPPTCPIPPTPSSPVECFQTCMTSADCIWEVDSCCCGCNMGGAPIAINSAYSAEWAARMAAMCPSSCMGVGCLAVFLCPPGPPSCVGGMCQ